MPKQPKEPGVGKGGWTRHQRAAKCIECGQEFNRVRSGVVRCEKCKARERKAKWRKAHAASVGGGVDLETEPSPLSMLLVFVGHETAHTIGDTIQYGVGSGKYHRTKWPTQCRACGGWFNTWKHYTVPLSLSNHDQLVGDEQVDWELWHATHHIPICHRCAKRAWARENRQFEREHRYDFHDFPS